jgi:U4/U6.U5 tri-snRNP-associated protein 2
VNDPSLDDIRLLLKPTFTPQQLPLLSQGQPAYDLAKKEYLPGFIGLNNISQASFMNAVLQALLHVAPFRDYFIHASQSGQLDQRSELVQRLGMLCRKFWSPKLFKSQVSPHEFLQEASTASGRRYKVTEAADPLDFLSWLLNALHRDLGGTKRARSSIVYSLFQGQLRVQDQAVLIKQEVDPYGYGTVTAKPTFETDRQVKTSFMPFLVLSVDLPPPPVFQDAVVKNIIPQVSIDEVLAKFDGRTAQNIPAKGLRRYKITDLPPVVILHYKRFTANNFVEEKNPTIVTYPLKGLDFRDCA